MKLPHGHIMYRSSLTCNFRQPMQINFKAKSNKQICHPNGQLISFWRTQLVQLYARIKRTIIVLFLLLLFTHLLLVLRCQIAKSPANFYACKYSRSASFFVLFTPCFVSAVSVAATFAKVVMNTITWISWKEYIYCMHNKGTRVGERKGVIWLFSICAGIA